MGYRIVYDQGTKHFEITAHRPWRPWLLTLGCFGLFVFLSSWFWPAGYAFLRDLLIPGEDAVTVQAFSNLSHQIQSGVGVKEAFQEFCREVLTGEAVIR